MVAVPHQQRKRLRSDGSSLAQCVIHLLVLRLFITADAQYSDCQRHFFSRGDDTHRHEFDVASFRSSLTGSTTSNRDSFDKSHLHRLEVELRRDGNHAVNISEKQGVRFCRRIYQALSLDLGIHQEALNSCKQQVYGLKHDDENRGDNDEVWFAGVVVPRLLPRSGRHDVAFENLPDPLRRVYSELHQQHLPITTTTAASEDSSLAEEDFCRRLLVADALQEQQDQQGQQQEMATADATSSDAPRDALLLQPRKAPREIAVPAPSPSSADVLTPSVVARTTSRYAPSSAAHHHHHHRSLMDDTPMPTINNQELTLCMDDLFTSDRECCPRDKRISQAEFIFVLNSRFALNLPENYPFASLHALYQQAYNEASAPGGEGPDISATIPGVSITAAQRQYLVQVCSILEAAHLEVLAQSPSAAPVPTASPNNNASPQPTSPATFRNKCNVAVLLNEDNDGLFGINVLEYVQVIRAVTGNASLGTSPQDGLVSFDALPAPLQAPFASYGTTTLPIAGAPGQRSPALNLFCDKVHFAVDRYQNPQPTVAPTPAPVPEDPCFARLVQADADQSNSLSPTEYLAYVGTIGGTWSGSPLDAVPFIVQKNYAWIRGVDAELDLTAATATTTPSLPTQRTLLTAACHRTKTIVEAAVAGNNGVELQEHCFAALTRADDNVDDDLNQDEFVQAVNFFIGLGYSSSFAGLDPEFRALFNANKGGANNAIGIDGSKPNQTPSQIEQLSLDFLCGKLDETLTAVQTTNVLLEKCRLSLGHATNTTTDGPSFSEADFVVFMHTLADVAVATGAQFSDLGADVQAFFPTFVEALRAIDTTVWVGGGPLADDQRTTMFNACTQAIELSGEVKPPPPPNQVTTIFSSFQIASSNNQSLTNASADFGNLAAAYTALVQAETAELAAAAASTRRRRYLRSSSQRQLRVVGVAEGSAQLYQLDDDLVCPSQEAEAGSTCQTVYGRFDLLYRNEANDVPELENQVTTHVQQAIADGDLQSALDAIDPASPLTILGPGTRTIPLDPTAPTPAPVGNDDDDDDDEFAGVGVPAFIGILAGVGFACCCLGGLFLCLYMSKQSGLGNSSASKSSVGGKSSSFPGSTIYQLEDETITSRHRNNSVDEDLSSFRDEPDVVEQAPAHHKKKRSKKRHKGGSGKRHTPPEQQPQQRSKKAPQSSKKKKSNSNKHTFDDEYSQDSSSSKGSSVNSSSDHSRSELEPALGADPLGGSYGLGPDDTGLGLYHDEPAAESDYGGSAGSSDHEFGLYKEPADAESEHDVVYKNAVVVDDWGRSSSSNRPPPPPAAPPPPPPPPTDTTWGTQNTNWGNSMNRQQQQQQPKSPRSPASNHSRGGTQQQQQQQQQQPTINSFFESDTGGNGTYGRASTTRSVGSGTTPTKASGGSSGGGSRGGGGGTASWGSGSPSRSSAVAPPPDAPFGDDRAEDDEDEFSATSRHETDDEGSSSSGSESAGRKVKPPRAAQRKYGYEYEDGDDDLEPEDEEDDEDDDDEEGEQDEESDEEDEEEGSSEEDDEESGGSSSEEDDTDDGDTWTSAERQKYRETIEALVQEVVPDEIEHVDAMMEQFVGREEELINTLRSMTTSASEDESEAETSDEEEDDEEEEEEEESSGEEESDEEEEESDEEESEEERTAASGDHTAGGKSYSFGSDSDDSSSGSGSSEYDEETVSS